MCMALKTAAGDTIQVDCGAQKGVKALSGLYRIRSYYRSCDIFILSHFHVDHYNGILYSSINGIVPPLRIKEVYYPGIPRFKNNQRLIEYLFTINLMVFGNESGVMAYDFIKSISRINEISFNYRPLYKGDLINVNGSVFEVLWPPRVLYHKKVLAVIERAIEDFERALEEDEETRHIYRMVKEEGIYYKYIEGGKTIRPNNNDIIFYKITEGRKLPEVVKKANQSLRKAANHLCLSFYQDDRILFLGDLENFELKLVVHDLMIKKRNHFLAVINPHHGTHWEDSLKNIRCIYSISSNGNKLISRFKQAFKDISLMHLSTHSNGDIILGHPLVYKRWSIHPRFLFF